MVSGWVENPYWQYFCGEVYFQHEAPVDPSSLTRFRRRIGESGCERILQVTVSAGVQSKAVKAADFKRVTVDTTVQEKAVSPTDSAEPVPGAVGTVMSQTGGGVTPDMPARAPNRTATVMPNSIGGSVNGYGTYLGRVVRDIDSVKPMAMRLRQAKFADELALAKRWRNRNRIKISCTASQPCVRIRGEGEYCHDQQEQSVRMTGTR